MTTETAKCVHHWLIDELPIAGEFTAHCHGCKTTRTFPMGIVERRVPPGEKAMYQRNRDFID